MHFCCLSKYAKKKKNILCGQDIYIYLIYYLVFYKIEAQNKICESHNFTI